MFGCKGVLTEDWLYWQDTKSKLRMDEDLNKTTLGSCLLCTFSVYNILIHLVYCKISITLRKALGEPLGSSQIGECQCDFCFADKVLGQA